MISIKQTMGLTLLQQKQKRNELQAHTHTHTHRSMSYVPAEKEQEYTKVSLSTQKSTHLLYSSAEDFSSWCTSRGAPTHTHAHANTERIPVCARGCLAHPPRCKMTHWIVHGSEELQILRKWCNFNLGFL